MTPVAKRSLLRGELWLRRFCLGNLAKYYCEPLSGTVNELREHSPQRSHRRYGCDFLHLRPVDELALEDTSEDCELVGKLLAEFVYEPRCDGGVFTAAVSDSHFPFERKRLVRVSELLERAAHERLLRDKVRDAVGTEGAAHCRLFRYGDFRKVYEYRRGARLERVFELVDDYTFFCFRFCHINWTKDLLNQGPRSASRRIPGVSTSAGVLVMDMNPCGTRFLWPCAVHSTGLSKIVKLA